MLYSNHQSIQPIFNITDFKRDTDTCYKNLLSSGKTGVIIQNSIPIFSIKAINQEFVESEKMIASRQKYSDKIKQFSKGKNRKVKLLNEDIDKYNY